MEHRSLSSNTTSWLYTRRGAIGRSLRAAQSAFTAPPSVTLRPTSGTQRYRLAANNTHAPWLSSMATKLLALLGTDILGAIAISLLNNSSCRLHTPTTTAPPANTSHYAMRRTFPLASRSHYHGPLH
jgi:hypothetical protein